MDILQTAANIAQIIGVCWTLIFGSKAIKDVINRKLPSSNDYHEYFAGSYFCCASNITISSNHLV